MSISKILSIVLAVLLGVSTVFIILLYAGKTVGVNEPQHLDLAITWAKILIFVTAGVTVFASIYEMIFITGNLLKPLIVLVILAILVIVSYTLSSGEILDLVGYKGKDNVPKILKLSDTGLYLTYIFFFLTIVAIVYTEISKVFKK